MPLNVIDLDTASKLLVTTRIRGLVKGTGITRTALILVGQVLAEDLGNRFDDSQLYAASHHHVLRPARKTADDTD